ncbi:elongation factor Tu [Streptomyces sp. NPDC046876]|uniref:elongation factor Tu n=1 Tax=Streptomyces sp. NPDC046876 TaxID=3155616 RepID=UPI0033D5BD8A
MTDEAYQRTKPHINIGTIGHHQHGKSTLTAAITHVLHDLNPAVNRAHTVEEIDKAPDERARRSSSDVAHVEYQTEERHYAHLDCPGHVDFIRNMIIGTDQMDAAILVVSASEGVQEQTREHVLLASRVGVPSVVVAITKCDLVDDSEAIARVEAAVRDLLDDNGYPGEGIRVVRVSALGALEGNERWRESVSELLKEMEAGTPLPRRAVDQPFYMPVESAHPREAGQGTVVTGKIERGMVKVDDTVSVVGLGPTLTATVAGIEIFRKTAREGQTGEEVGLLLHGVEPDEVVHGQVLAEPGSITPHQVFEAQVHFLSEEEGGRHTPVSKGYRPQFFFHTADVTGTLDFEPDELPPGSNHTVRIELMSPIAVERGQRFAVRESGLTVAFGRVSRVIT